MTTPTLTQFQCTIEPLEKPLNVFIHEDFNALFAESGLGDSILNAYLAWLETHEDKLKQQLITYFSNPTKSTFTPVFIYHDGSKKLTTLLADRRLPAIEPGEEGSILATIRYNHYDDSLMCSDCFGQLSCSSCAIEILAGRPANPEPREEEYDMLDIDEDRPPTQHTRLGCQTIIGDHALIGKIRV